MSSSKNLARSCTLLPLAARTARATVTGDTWPKWRKAEMRLVTARPGSLRRAAYPRKPSRMKRARVRFAAKAPPGSASPAGTRGTERSKRSDCSVASTSRGAGKMDAPRTASASRRGASRAALAWRAPSAWGGGRLGGSGVRNLSSRCSILERRLAALGSRRLEARSTGTTASDSTCTTRAPGGASRAMAARQARQTCVYPRSTTTVCASSARAAQVTRRGTTSGPSDAEACITCRLIPRLARVRCTQARPSRKKA
mmetsp:Transcript_26826/g.72354  ORF Transcript_26826/g.72354 Transcript_26826/m.72354 type:complete len:256 (-) Transcript_26826:238-1005(-)